MKAVCPNDASHKRFVTSVHVAQEWVVDEHGEFVEATNECSEVTHGPDVGNFWSCYECGADAEVSSHG